MRQRQTLAALIAALAVAAGLAAIWGNDVQKASRAAADGAACADSVRDEFVRQQALVDWDVYCPSELPDGVRLATSDDPPPEADQIARDARPTIDDLNPGGGTFLTRLVGGDAREFALVQGAGANIYFRRDEARCTGCREVPRRGAMFGDLSGSLFELDPPAVIAIDGDFGHMLLGDGNVIEIAAAMAPVRTRPPELADTLLRVTDLTPGDWLPGWAADPSGDFAERPNLCAGAVLEPPARTAKAWFSGATWPYEDGHPPALYEAALDFDDEGAASAYIAAARGAIERCAALRFDDPALAWRALPYDDLGDESAGVRMETRNDVQGSDTDIVLFRRGSRVYVIWHYELVPAGGATDERKLLPIARAAVARASGVKIETRAPVAPATPVPAAVPSSGSAVVDEIIRLALARDNAALRALLRTTDEPCTYMSSPGSGPACRDGEPEGTMAASIQMGVCDGISARVDGEFEVVPPEPFRLWAVTETAGEPPVQRIIFPSDGPVPESGFYLDVAGGRIFRIFKTCGGPAAAVQPGSAFLIAPPAS